MDSSPNIPAAEPTLPNTDALMSYINSLVEARLQQITPLVSQVPVSPIPPRLPLFKITSVPPPSFDGSSRHRQAHDNQRIIDDYLHKSEQLAFLHGFLADNCLAYQGSHPSKYSTKIDASSSTTAC